MDKAERLARDMLSNPQMTLERGISDVANAIQAYAEQCRRAGAEAMREAAADFLRKVASESAKSFRWYGRELESIANSMGAIPLPSAAEAADLATPYRPTLINYPDSGDSEFVMFDTGCIYEEVGDYAVIKDMSSREPIGFRWRTKCPPTNVQSRAEAASPAAGWRPIDTAERKPDNVIWAAHPGFKPFLAQWALDTEGACWISVEGGCDYKPTLWMPAVAPPNPPSEEARAG